MKLSRRRAEEIFAVIGLTFFSGGFFALSTGGTGGEPIFPSFVISMIRYSVWTISFLLVCLRWRAALHTASRDVFLWLLTLVILLSWIWVNSGAEWIQTMTLQDRSREILLMSCFGLYFATSFSLQKQVKLLAWTFGIVVLASALLGAFVPSMGVDQVIHVGAWKGVFGDKNVFGQMMCLATLIFLSLPGEGKKIDFKWILVGLSVLLLLLSRSGSSLVVAISCITLFLYLKSFRWKGKLAISILSLSVLIFFALTALVSINTSTIIEAMGKDPTLTGRTQIWEFAGRAILNRPILGYGRGAFWQAGSQFSMEAIRKFQFLIPHSHNGYLDLLLDVGIVGFSLFIISFLIAYLRSTVQAFSRRRSEDVWPLLFLTYLAIINYSENYLLFVTQVNWVLYISIALSVDRFKQHKTWE
jgi:O-antigen ligase